MFSNDFKLYLNSKINLNYLWTDSKTIIKLERSDVNGSYFPFPEFLGGSNQQYQ